MRRIITLVGALVAALALSGIAAGAALAVHEDQGPFYTTGAGAGARLGAAETREVNAATSEGEWELVAGTRVVKCTGTSVAAGGTIEDPAGENAGKSTETVKFSGCSVSGNGTGCAVENNEVTTKSLKNTLGYQKKETNGEGGGKIFTLFAPSSGTEFATLHFTGAGCTVTSTKVELKAGCTPACEGVIGQGETEAHGNVLVDSEPADAFENDLTFPATEIKAIWIETNGVLAEKKGGIAAFGVKAQQKGSADVTVANGGTAEEWGVHTGS